MPILYLTVASDTKHGEGTMEETREEQIARWERNGHLDQDCKGCAEFYSNPGMPSEVWAPRHKASPRCQSGKHPHCTCDTCF